MGREALRPAIGRGLLVLGMTLFLSACGGGGGGSGGDTGGGDGGGGTGGGGSGGGTAKVVGGSIAYLTDVPGEVRLVNNETGDALTLSEGETSFEFDVDSGAEYAIEASSYTVDGVRTGYGCRVENGSGAVGSSDVSDVAITCGRNVRLAAIDGYVNNQGLITFLFQVQDATTGSPIATGSGNNSLSNDDFELTEFDDLNEEIGIGSESFVSIVPRSALKFELRTVLSIDNSNSIGTESLAEMKAAALSLVSDDFFTDTGAIDCAVTDAQSDMLPGQKISIRTFAGDETPVTGFTDDLQELCYAINGIGLAGGTTTVVFNAIENGLNSWQNRFTLSSLTLGYLVLITDGQDESISGTAEQQRVQELLSLRDDGNKLMYTIGVGNDVDDDQLREFGNGGFARLENYSQVEGALRTASEQLAGVANSLAFLEYATGKRTGQYRAVLTVADNIYEGSGYALSGDYTALESWGSGVPATLDVVGERNINEGDLLELNAVVRYTSDADPVFTWDPTTTSGKTSIVSGGSDSDSVILKGVSGGQDQISVMASVVDAGTDGVENSPYVVTVNVSDLTADIPDAMSTSDSVELSVESNLPNPNFSWSAATETAYCYLSGSGSTVTLQTGSSAGTCTVTVSNLNGSGTYRKQITVGTPNASSIMVRELGSGTASSLSSTDFEDGIPDAFTDDAVKPWILYAENSPLGAAGSSSIRSALLEDDQSSSIELYVEGEISTLSFDYAISSEASFDILELTVNGSNFMANSGDVPWTHASFDISSYGVDDDSDGSPEFRIRWVYDKDGSQSHGDDAAYLDNIVLE